MTLLLVAGAAAWWLSFRTFSEGDPTSLDALPFSLGGWQATSIEMDQSVADMLNADHNVQRAYQHRLGYTTFVYIGYYGTGRGGTPEHTPDVCYPSQGWAITEDTKHRVGGQNGLELSEYVVEKEGERRLVHFWYRTGRASGMTSIWQLRLSHFWGRLGNSGGDGALIRLSTPLDVSDYDAVQGRLFAMDTLVEAELDRKWPSAERDLAHARAKVTPDYAKSRHIDG